MSPLNAWAFSFACSIGWAAFVMPGAYFLPVTGFWGSILGFVIAAVSISVIALNYHFLANNHEGPGDIYRLVRLSVSRESGFVAAWSMCISYLCCFALNARALAMLLRTVLEEITGYQFHVYLIAENTLLIDAVIIIISLLVFGQLNIHGIRQIARIQTVGALVLLGGCIIMLVAAWSAGYESASIPVLTEQPKEQLLSGFMAVFILTPWAYVGFDSLSKVHQAITFPKKRLGTIMIIAILCVTFVYVGNILTAVRGIPGDASSWSAHLNLISQMPGASAYPVAIAAKKAMGRPGTLVFYLSCICAAVTGLVGFSSSVSRLIFQMAHDNVLPRSIAKIHPKYHTPRNAVWTIVCIAAALIVLLNSFSFIEELASFATSVGFGLVSFSALRTAIHSKKRAFMITGALGALICLLWLFFMLVRISGLNTTISKQAIGSIAIWAFLGIATYCVFNRKEKS